MINSTKLGNYSHQAVLFDIGEYGYLLTEDWTVGTLSYVREDMVLRLFDIKVSLSDRRPMIMVNDRIYMDTGKIVSTEIGDSDIVGKLFLQLLNMKTNGKWANKLWLNRLKICLL